MRSALLLLFVLFLRVPPTYATDHRDGPRTTSNAHADILDLFSFIQKGQNGKPRLVLIMTAFPKAKADQRFDESVQYRFRIKPIGLSRSNGALVIKRGDGEDSIRCNATTAASNSSGNPTQVMSCKFYPNACSEDSCATQIAAMPLNSVTSENSRTKVFAGVVQDPFFSDVFRARGKHPRAEEGKVFSLLGGWLNWIGVTVPFANSKALALVVEIDLRDLTVTRDYHGLIGVAAESLVKDAGAKDYLLWDRAGRVEVTNFILCFRPIKSDYTEKVLRFLGGKRVDLTCTHDQGKLKDQYNKEDAFELSPVASNKYRKLFRRGLKVLDSIDSDSTGQLDWDHYSESGGGKEHPLLAALLEHDYLVIDPKKTCKTEKGARSYLDVEMSELRNLPSKHDTCGGRVPNDDVIDTTITVFANGPDRLPAGWWSLPGDDKSIARIRRRDGVENAGRIAPNCFPWLAPSQFDVNCQ